MRIAAASVFGIFAYTALHFSPAQADEFPLVSQDGFEACSLAFADFDGDGFGGAGDVAHRCDPLPAAYVRTGGDCNDFDEDFFPGAIELTPDEALSDENCDGVDGDAAVAVFVSPTGSTDPSCGARRFPCALSVAASVAAATGKSQLFLARGDHTGPLLLGSAGPLRGVFGGYSGDFLQRSADPMPRPTRLLGGEVGEVTVALQLSGPGAWAATDVALIAPDAVGQIGGGAGRGSFGIRLRGGAELDLRRSDVVAGAGAPGAAGMAGASADPLARLAQMQGETGGAGAELNVTCDATSRGLGGLAGSNSCGSGRATNGGAGGNGGTMDTSCGALSSNFTATFGSGGMDAAVYVGVSGAGGSGGSGGSSCGPTTGGSSGAVTDGVGGVRATATTTASDVVFAGNGGPGTLGLNGTGGGGGGGSGGCDEGTDAYGPGGGGGGAGGCAAPAPGLGGSGGGSSIGIGAFTATLLLEEVHIATASGGDGGHGGAGGQGQAPGLGGFGGANPGSAAPGRGGDGGRGGHSGGGAGGNGGHSIGIFGLDAAVFGTASYSLGNPGAPGMGGVAPAAAGQSGNGGAAANVFACASPSAC